MPNYMRAILCIGLAGLLGYSLFIYEPPHVAKLREYCAAKNETVEKRRNAISVDLLPYPLANYHHACSGAPQPLYRR